MDENLKVLLGMLGQAINETLAESDRIAESVGEIKNAGYNTFLVLEATIGFSKREDQKKNSKNKKKDLPEPKNKPSKVKFTVQDKRFTDSLGIVDPSE